MYEGGNKVCSNGSGGDRLGTIIETKEGLRIGREENGRVVCTIRRMSEFGIPEYLGKRKGARSVC